jgi:hypothetical protein
MSLSSRCFAYLIMDEEQIHVEDGPRVVGTSAFV